MNIDKLMTIGTVVDKTWAFIPSDNSEFLCLFRDGKTKYLFFGQESQYKRVDGKNVMHFDGTLYKMPEKEILKKERARGLKAILISDRLENPTFMPQMVMEARNVPQDYLESLEQYIEKEI